MLILTIVSEYQYDYELHLEEFLQFFLGTL